MARTTSISSQYDADGHPRVGDVSSSRVCGASIFFYCVCVLFCAFGGGGGVDCGFLHPNPYENRLRKNGLHFYDEQIDDLDFPTGFRSSKYHPARVAMDTCQQHHC